MSDDSHQGALTADDIEQLWVAAVDISYAEPFLTTDAARDAGNSAAIGFVPYEQAFAQLARVSTAVDISTQASYILPWSGQTNPPAQGEQKATVTLVFNRALRPDIPLRIGAGLVFFEEETTDWGIPVGVTVRTGRRYTLTQDLVFMPGDVGPFSANAIAENVGWGYNNPLHGTIQFIDQPGTGFTHDRGTVTITPGSPVPPAVPTAFEVVTLITVNEADTFIPEHVGQYVSFTVGANAGKIARVISFTPPNPNAIPPIGSTVTLEPLGVFESFTVLVPGTFVAGEMLNFENSGSTSVAYGSFVSAETLANGHRRIAYVLLSGSVGTAMKVIGMTSATSVSVDTQLLNPTFTAEAPPGGGGAGGATWIVLDWVNDLGLTVTNPQSPAGGRLGMLDGIGFERKIPRAPGEDDDDYRQRVWQIADVITPNAIKRTLNRIGPGPWCLREVGSALLPGFFYDRTDEGGDAWDYDVLQFHAGLGIPPWDPSFFQEPIQIHDQFGNIKASGYLGRADSSGVITMIRKSGEGTARFPITLLSTDVLVGLVGHWTAPIFSSMPYNSVGLPTNKRFQFYLDYEQFRGFFLIGVPRQATGEFGNAYDVGADNAFDLPSPHRTFYDGSAFGSADAAFYKRVYQAVDRIRAGGVGFDLYIEDGTCT